MKYMKLLLILSTISSAQAMMGERTEQWQGARSKTPAAKAAQTPENVFYTYANKIYDSYDPSHNPQLPPLLPNNDATKTLISKDEKLLKHLCKGWMESFSLVNALSTEQENLLKDISSNSDDLVGLMLPSFKHALNLKYARAINNKKIEEAFLQVLKESFKNQELRDILGLPTIAQAPYQQSFSNLSTVKGPTTDQSRRINNFPSASQAHFPTLPQQPNFSWMSEEELSTLIYTPPTSANEPAVKVHLKRIDLPPIIDTNKITGTFLKFYNAVAELPVIKDANKHSIFNSLRSDIVTYICTSLPTEAEANELLKLGFFTKEEAIDVERLLTSSRQLFEQFPDVLVKALMPKDITQFNDLRAAWADAASITDRSGIAGSLKKKLESKSRDQISELMFPHFRAALLLKATDDVSKDNNCEKNEVRLKNLHDLNYTDAFIDSFVADLFAFDTSEEITSSSEEFFDAASSLDTCKPAEDVKQFVDDLILFSEEGNRPPVIPVHMDIEQDAAEDIGTKACTATQALTPQDVFYNAVCSLNIDNPETIDPQTFEQIRSSWTNAAVVNCHNKSMESLTEKYNKLKESDIQKMMVSAVQSAVLLKKATKDLEKLKLGLADEQSLKIAEDATVKQLTDLTLSFIAASTFTSDTLIDEETTRLQKI